LKEITLGHTPDADDAFMFYGLIAGKVASLDFRIKHVVDDIETLNKRALKHEIDVTAISAHAYAYLKDYIILRSGASFGLNYGPVVVSKKRLSITHLKNSIIATPGKMTSANLLLNLAIGRFIEKEMNFQLIPEAVLNDEVDAGILIHEAQITYSSLSLRKVLSLGAWWDATTNGLLVPLGINVASIKSMTSEEIRRFNELFKESILYGLKNRDAALDYAMRYSRRQPKNVMSKFIDMYVSNVTIDMGTIGELSIKEMFKMGQQRGILPMNLRLIFA
jgi:1,4-dihydroxy-6-naphthoate synthase